MNSVLLACGRDKSREALTGLLVTSDFSQVSVAENGSEARRMLLAADYDLIIIDAPLPDEFGHDFALYAAENTASGVLILVKAELADSVAAKAEDYGVAVVAKPMNRQLFFQAVKLVTVSRRRLLGLRDENLQLQKKIEEIRLVDRSKYALMQYLKMTEPQAHRYIEKQAMDLRITRREVALNILKTYEV